MEADWYERRHEMRPDQVFRMYDDSLVKLDRRVPGDGTDWYVASRYGSSWVYEDARIHPNDLVELVGFDR